ncbi:MAG TPA: hypothetical protein VGI39_17485 [Polyangiaceae bacterium]|jgi:hypothetical protein
MSDERMEADARAIQELMTVFFSAFADVEVATGSLDRLPALFAPDAKVTILSAAGLSASSVSEFIAPRRGLFARGVVSDFVEWETGGETLLGTDIACRRCRYAKKGVREGTPFTGAGTKVFTFVRLGGVWRILALLWHDDP